MVLRLAKPTDVSSILHIYKYYVENSSYTFDYKVPSEEEYVYKIISSHCFLVAEQNNRIYGFAYAGYHRIKPAYQWICESTIYIIPSKTSGGIGKKLYATLIAILQHQGYMSILAGITSPNPTSVRFHQSLGFKHAYSYDHVGYKFNKWHSVDWYRLDLASFNVGNPPQIRSIVDLGQEELNKILLQYSI